MAAFVCDSSLCLCAAEPTGATGSAATSAAPVTLLRLGLGPGTGTAVDPQPWRLNAALAGAGDRSMGASLGVEFNTVGRGPAPWGQWRLPLTGDSAFQVRPRARSVGVTYSLQF